MAEMTTDTLPTRVRATAWIDKADKTTVLRGVHADTQELDTLLQRARIAGYLGLVVQTRRSYYTVDIRNAREVVPQDLINQTWHIRHKVIPFTKKAAAVAAMGLI